MDINKIEASLCPSHFATFQYLRSHGSITRMEAMMYLRVGCITKTISVLRSTGIPIRSERKHDEFGRRYMRYVLEPMECTANSVPQNM